MTRRLVFSWLFAGCSVAALPLSLGCYPPATQSRETMSMSAGSADPGARSPGMGVAQGVETEADEFTGEVLFVLRHPLPPETGGPRGAAITLVGGPGPGSVLMSASVPGDEWRYLRCDSVHILADAQPVRVDGGHRERGHVSRYGVIEHVHAELPWESVVQIAGAQTVRVRICTDVFTLGRSFTADAGELSRRMWDAAPAERQVEVQPATDQPTEAPSPVQH